MQKGRPHRVGELIREEVARLLIKGVKDPRIGFVSVMSVRMSSDLHYANVYVSLYGEAKERKSSMVALQNSAGWIRREVGKHLRLRYTPELRFFPDETLDEVYHLEELFEGIHAEQEAAPMNRVSLELLVEEFRASGPLLLTSHVHPDGDAVGSLLGLYHFLRALGKTDVQCVLSDPPPRVYRTLPGADKIKACDGEIGPYDTLVVVDVSSLERTGEAAQFAVPGKKVIVVDHHLEENPDGTLGFIDASYAAVGEIIAELFRVAEVPITAEAAHCAYVAQITDTGGYRYSNTNARSHRIASDLLETGLNVAAINGEVFDQISVNKFEMLRRALARAKFAAGGRVAYSNVSYEDLEEIGGDKEDMNGLVNHLRNIAGVQAGILFNAPKAGVTKVSLRSGPALNASEFMREFDGGGHAAAAGATIEREMAEVRSEMLARLEEVLTEGEGGAA